MKESHPLSMPGVTVPLAWPLPGPDTLWPLNSSPEGSKPKVNAGVASESEDVDDDDDKPL